MRPALRLPAAPPPGWPRFRSRLHSAAVTARIGRVLGICFGICFVTGVLSHYQYKPWRWLPEPASPAWGYWLTQGLHVITGIACIPLLLVKLWSVYPKLWEWPPARSVLHAIERLSIAVLVASAVTEVAIGFVNILDWYPWHFGFVFVHRTLAYVVIGSLLVHIAVKLPVIRNGLATPLTPATLRSESDEDATSGLSRRGLLSATAAGVVVLAATTAGQTFTPLRRLALRAPRRPEDGPLGIPINKTATEAGVLRSAIASTWRLSVVGPTPFVLDLADFEALPTLEHKLPIACVEGWSASGRWRGPALLDLVRRAGGSAHSRVQVASLEQGGAYRTSVVDGPQLSHALLATHLNGQRIPLDHGYPVRLIAPDRAGVLNTKWLTRIEIL
jgi:Oxidoreductase molybdopterin binding domain